MKTKIRNRLLMLRGTVAMEVEASSDDLRRWLSISVSTIEEQLKRPAAHRVKGTEDLESMRNKGKRFIFHLQDLEVDREAVRKELEEEVYYGPEDVAKSTMRHFYDLDDVEECLRNDGHDPEALVEPWRCDFP